MIHHFDNRTVAIVGNSSAIMTRSDGLEIDGHDVVIRFNDAWPTTKNMRQIGSRTSFMSCAVRDPGMQRRAIESNVKLIWPSLSTRRMLPEMRSRCFCLNNANRRSAGIKLRVNNTPSSGILVLNWILDKTKASKITLYGFDSFKNPDWHTRLYARIDTPHDSVAEKNLLDRLDEEGKIYLVRYGYIAPVKSIPKIIKAVSDEIVILGSGPTVIDFVEHNKQFIDDRITIGGNSISELYPPDCYVCCDRHAWGLYGEQLHEKSPYKFFGFDIKNYLPRKKLVEFNHREDAFWLYYSNSNCVGYDPNVIYHGRTVGVIAINIAMWMNPKKIYIAGMDGYSTAPDRHNYFNGKERPPHKNNPNDTVSRTLRCIKKYADMNGVKLALVTRSIHESVLPLAAL
jgi:hypothetical protein